MSETQRRDAFAWIYHKLTPITKHYDEMIEISAQLGIECDVEDSIGMIAASNKSNDE